MNVRPFLFWLENGQWFAIHEQFESSKSVFLENFFGAKKKVVLREFAVGLFRRWSPTCI